MRPSDRDQHAQRQERGPRHGEEVEVVVDECVRAVREQQARQSRSRPALIAVDEPQPSASGHDRAADHGEAEDETHDPEVGEQLQWDAVRLGDGRRALAVAPAGERERPGARASDRAIGGDVERLSPPLQTVVGAEVGQPPRVVDALAARELRARPGVGVADLGDKSDGGDGHPEHAEDDERALAAGGRAAPRALVP